MMGALGTGRWMVLGSRGVMRIFGIGEAMGTGDRRGDSAAAVIGMCVVDSVLGEERAGDAGNRRGDSTVGHWEEEG